MFYIQKNQQYKYSLLFFFILTVLVFLVMIRNSAATPDFEEVVSEINPPRPTSSPGKIEVLEFFSYTCNHCYDLSEAVQSWSEKLPDDVVFKRIAAPGSMAWTNTARLFYALEATGDLAKLDSKIFKAIHQDRQIFFSNEKSMTAWVGKNGGDSTKFSEAYNSFGINSRMQQASQLAADYGVSGVPVFIVNGIYRVPAYGSAEETMSIVNRAIEMVRSNKEVAAPKEADAPQGADEAPKEVADAPQGADEAPKEVTE